VQEGIVDSTAAHGIKTSSIRTWLGLFGGEAVIEFQPERAVPVGPERKFLSEDDTPHGISVRRASGQVVAHAPEFHWKMNGVKILLAPGSESTGKVIWQELLVPKEGEDEEDVVRVVCRVLVRFCDRVEQRNEGFGPYANLA
jgi:hypothetical protein